uniref:Drebrin n=1 Tax=Sphaeramia orbicularis TaxID=375764 RepID=A0A673CIM3_9TELE
MSTRTVNLDTYSLSLLTAKEDILNPRSSTNWALFTYDGVSNKLKLADSGAGGVAELAGKFHIAKPQYGLCRMGNAETGGTRIAMIKWLGQNVDDYRRTECANHIPAIKNFFKEAHVFIGAEKEEDVTEERIRAELSKAQNNASTQWVRRSSRSADKEELVGTNYRKTNAAMEMRLINRDSFWARAERKEEERRRAAEERRRLERERVLKERKDAEERDRKMNEKLQMIEEQRRKQAEQEEVLRRQEKLKWEQQQREHEDDMRARLRRSESIEKAAEAAALVSQRSMNPREFFRQLSSSSSQSPTSPGSRYQRSLTDTAFIFSKAEESTSSSPRSSPLVSPFSRAPPSPFYRTTSPPTSPDFRPVTSPQRPRAPMSPPTSPLRPAPPALDLPSVPQTSGQVKAVFEPKAPSPTEPSAPPASPTLLASFLPSSEKNTSSQSHPEALPASPPNSPLIHLFTAAEQVADIGYKVQAVLVEEDEEEETEVQEEDKEETQPCAVNTEEEKGKEQEKEEEEREEEEQEVEQEQEKKVEEEVEEEEEEEEKEEQPEEEKEEEGLKQESEPATLEEPVEFVQEKEEEEEEEEEDEAEEVNDQSKDSQAPAEPVELPLEDEDISITGSFILHRCLHYSLLPIKALYDYQAEDESEISFEPGDIIRDVETVDKAWWRGWSKDGRQGLFPANYVETI